MKYFGEDEINIKAECTSCHRVLKINKQYITSLGSTAYRISPTMKCICGRDLSRIEGTGNTLPQSNLVRVERKKRSGGGSTCPKCKSEKVSPITENRISPGGLLLGGILFGKKSVTMNYCMSCGNKWQP